MPIKSSSESEIESEDERPVAERIAKRYVTERDGFSDEDDIPLMELAHRLCQRQDQSNSDTESHAHSDDPMDIDFIQSQPCSEKIKVKKLLKTIVGIL